MIRHHVGGGGGWESWLDKEGNQIGRVGNYGQSNLAGFLLKLDNAETNMAVQRWRVCWNIQGRLCSIWSRREPLPLLENVRPQTNVCQSVCAQINGWGRRLSVRGSRCFSESLSSRLGPVVIMAHGNQRELARQKNMKKSQEISKGKRKEDSLTTSQRKQRQLVCLKNLQNSANHLEQQLKEGKLNEVSVRTHLQL